MSQKKRIYKLVVLAVLLPVIVLAVWVASIIGMPDHVKNARIPISRIGSISGLEGLEADIEDRISRGRYPGAVFVVAKGGEILHAAALGVSDIEKGTKMRMESIFRSMSMTKPVTVVAVMQLVENGQIELDAPVIRYLPELDNHSHPEGAPLTIRHLLTHTGGQAFSFFLPEGPMTLADRIKELAEKQLNSPPGKLWRYNGVDAFDIVARVVEVVSGQPFAQYLEQHIFEPLGMSDTGYIVPAKDCDRLVEAHKARWGSVKKDEPFDFFYPSGGAGLFTTALDYSRFAQMLANGGALGGSRVLSQTMVGEIAREQLPADFPGLTGEFAFALGMRRVSEDSQQWSPLPTGSYGWSGAYGTHFWVNPETGFSAVFMINLTNAGGAGSPDAFDFERLVVDACKSDSRCLSESLEGAASTTASP